MHAQRIHFIRREGVDGSHQMSGVQGMDKVRGRRLFRLPRVDSVRQDAVREDVPDTVRRADSWLEQLGIEIRNLKATRTFPFRKRFASLHVFTTD
jgi:hypothetical protein